jgi:hypothetical protein
MFVDNQVSDQKIKERCERLAEESIGRNTLTVLFFCVSVLGIPSIVPPMAVASGAGAQPATVRTLNARLTRRTPTMIPVFSQTDELKPDSGDGSWSGRAVVSP